jgi:hypothetical protein
LIVAAGYNRQSGVCVTDYRSNAFHTYRVNKFPIRVKMSKIGKSRCFKSVWMVKLSGVGTLLALSSVLPDGGIWEESDEEA